MFTTEEYLIYLNRKITKDRITLLLYFSDGLMYVVKDLDYKIKVNQHALVCIKEKKTKKSHLFLSSV